MNPRVPDFICIGAQKAGTTWFHDKLGKHPRIWLPGIKELHYFDGPLDLSLLPPRLASERVEEKAWRAAVLAELQGLAAAGKVADAAWLAMHSFLDRDDDWYRALFAFAPENCRTGEVTPRYMLCGPDEIAHMHRTAPDAKLFFLLRHPVERFWSQCRMKLANGTMKPGEGAAMQLFETANGRPRGEYSKAILRFCERYDPGQMLIVFHEAIRQKPLEVMRAAWEFLGLERMELDAEDLAKPVNKSQSREAMPSGLRGRIDAAYRYEMETLADVFGGYAESWIHPAAAPEVFPAAIRLTADHVEALGRHRQRAKQTRSKSGKVFCLSMQRSGTTSVGDWLEGHGLTRAGSPTSVRKDWTRLWMEGRHQEIFSSPEFEQTEVFEDDPWWCPDFFRVVAERFPDARFILLERDPEAWFDSMCHHSGGRNPGWSDVHARIYEREDELRRMLRESPGVSADNGGLLSILEHREHYISFYRRHGEKVREYFRNQPGRLFCGRLEDPSVFEGMLDFVGARRNPLLPVPRSNARTEEMRKALERYRIEGSWTAEAPNKEEAITVFVVSWGRPLYLWACLDALHRLTRTPARFVLLDNAHPDPMVGQVISGFERRGMFDEVLRFDTNEFENIKRAYRERLEGLGPLHVYIESDCVIAESPDCWLAEMRRIMTENPRLGVLGSLIDPEDFVPREKAMELTQGDAASAEFLAKLGSPERGFLQDRSWERKETDYFLPKDGCPITNPAGRLMMLRTPLMRELGFQLDGPLAGMLRERGWEPAVTPRVVHRHLSLLNIFDYADYDERARNGFFAPITPKPT